MRSVLSAFGVLLLGDAIIMILGTAWLSTLIGFEKALSAGFLIFLPAEALKIALATALTRMFDPRHLARAFLRHALHRSPVGGPMTKTK